MIDMSVTEVRSYLKEFNMADRMKDFEASSATVELAAKALGVEEARIAKTLSFYGPDGCCILVVTAGDVKIDNKKFKNMFGLKAKMLRGDDVKKLTGHEKGGVCPFANPACGSANSAIELKPEELFQCAKAVKWVDVTKAAGAPK